MTHSPSETDYLVIGAGAIGMAFVDSLLTSSPDASARNLHPWRARLPDDSLRRRDGDRRGGVRELKTTISRLSAFARRLL